jgi:hypothetical protein
MSAHEEQIEAGAQALMAAFPTLLNHFTPEWTQPLAIPNRFNPEEI